MYMMHEVHVAHVVRVMDVVHVMYVCICYVPFTRDVQLTQSHFQLMTLQLQLMYQGR